jgi:nickel-dependent lactate racemase
MPSGGSPGLPYGGGLLDLPRLPFRLDPVESVGPTEQPAQLSAEGLEAGLRELAGNLLALPAAGRQTLLVVVSDGSRRTGADCYLPRLVSLLRQAGRFDIRFIVASGLHRRPEEDEAARILGGDLAERFPVFLHDPDDEDRLVELGTTRRGTVVQVNRHLLEHDRILLTGGVGFHYHAGFSGGRKSLVPGLAGRKTIAGNQLQTLQADGSRHPESRAGVLDGNPVHEDMLEGASMVRPPLTVNTVQAPDGSFEGIWTGEMDSAHREACSYLMQTRAIRLAPRELIVVSAGGHPSDINLIQAHKAFEAIFPAVRPGGTVILTAACPEGLGDDEFRQGILTGSEAELVAALLADYRVYGQTALAWRRKLAGCRLILVSRLPPSLVRETGAEPAASLAEAMQLAAARLQGPVKGWLFRQGSRWLVE